MTLLPNRGPYGFGGVAYAGAVGQSAVGLVLPQGGQSDAGVRADCPGCAAVAANGESALILALDAPLAPLWVWLVFAQTPAGTTLMGGGFVLTAVFGHILWQSGLAKAAA